MLGLPTWLWVIVAVLVLLFLLARSYYKRFRGMCRTVRDELTELLKTRRPDLEVVGEPQGNLVLRSGEAERVWELVDVYVSVARLPGMGRDPAARATVYESALAALEMGEAGADQPLERARHGERIKPQLVTPQTLADFPPEAGILQTPLAGLGLVVVYVLDLPSRMRLLTEQDRNDLGLSLPELHRLALDNLARGFPEEVLVGPREQETGSALQLSDPFNATRVLLIPSRLREGEELIALLPHGDLLVLLPGSATQDEARLQQGMQMLECQEHPPLLNRPVRVSRAGLALL